MKQSREHNTTDPEPDLKKKKKKRQTDKEEHIQEGEEDKRCEDKEKRTRDGRREGGYDMANLKSEC